MQSSLRCVASKKLYLTSIMCFITFEGTIQLTQNNCNSLLKCAVFAILRISPVKWNRDCSQLGSAKRQFSNILQQWNTFASGLYLIEQSNRSQDAGKVWKYYANDLSWIDRVSRIIDMIDEHERMKMVRFILTIGGAECLSDNCRAFLLLIYSKGQIKSWGTRLPLPPVLRIVFRKYNTKTLEILLWKYSLVVVLRQRVKKLRIKLQLMRVYVFTGKRVDRVEDQIEDMKQSKQSYWVYIFILKIIPSACQIRLFVNSTLKIVFYA